MIAELDESLADCFAVQRSLVVVVFGPSVGGFDARKSLLDFEGEVVALLLGDGRAGVPQLVRAWAELAFGARISVGVGAGGRGIVPGPVAWVAVAGGVCFGPDFQRADRCLDGTIVPWHTGRRVQDFHAEVFCE